MSPLRVFPCLLLAFAVGIPGAAQTSDSQTASSAPATTTEHAEDSGRASRLLRTLPEGLAANPPSSEELKAQNLTWRGEYEADSDGKPVLGPDARPIPVLYNHKGKRLKPHIKPLKSHPLNIANGTLTVDGWTGKAHLNFDIPEHNFLYFSTPGTGTVIVSQTAFPGSTEQKEAFHGETLTVKTDGHEIQLASDKPLSGKTPTSAWVRTDPAFLVNPRYPVMGFGPILNPPYAWPSMVARNEKHLRTPPPLPASMVQAGPDRKANAPTMPEQKQKESTETQ